MKKSDREKVKSMFAGRCAYCGCSLSGNSWHVDHVKPLFRGWETKPECAGGDVVENMFPACPRCNIRKGTLSVEQFRSEIQAQTARLLKNNQYKLALDYEIIKETFKPVVFCFELYKTPKASGA